MALKAEQSFPEKIFALLDQQRDERNELNVELLVEEKVFGFQLGNWDYESMESLEGMEPGLEATVDILQRVVDKYIIETIAQSATTQQGGEEEEEEGRRRGSRASTIENLNRLLEQGLIVIWELIPHDQQRYSVFRYGIVELLRKLWIPSLNGKRAQLGQFESASGVIQQLAELPDHYKKQIVETGYPAALLVCCRSLPRLWEIRQGSIKFDFIMEINMSSVALLTGVDHDTSLPFLQAGWLSLVKQQIDLISPLLQAHREQQQQQQEEEEEEGQERRNGLLDSTSSAIYFLLLLSATHLVLSVDSNLPAVQDLLGGQQPSELLEYYARQLKYIDPLVARQKYARNCSVWSPSAPPALLYSLQHASSDSKLGRLAFRFGSYALSIFSQNTSFREGMAQHGYVDLIVKLLPQLSPPDAQIIVPCFQYFSLRSLTNSCNLFNRTLISLALSDYPHDLSSLPPPILVHLKILHKILPFLIKT